MAINESTKLELEKIESLKDPIEKLFVKEGRSRSYIARLFDIDRHRLASKLNEWGFIQGNVYHPTPSLKKAIMANKTKIINMLDADISLKVIAAKTGLSLNAVSKVARTIDAELRHHFEMAADRRKKSAQLRRNNFLEASSRDYVNEFPDDEAWKPILGFDGYEISNKGRVRKYVVSYKTYYILRPCLVARNNRYYVHLHADSKRKAFSVARLVAHAFVPGWSTTCNTVNHIDYNPLNNCASNLEWVSQAENNTHAFRVGGKAPVIAHSKHGRFKKIIVDDTYEFKTIRAVAKFLNVSESQAHRYIDGESATDHTFKFIY